MRKLLSVVLAIALLPNPCWGWGREGHQIIAAVAENHLSETARIMIQSLIGNNHLYSIAVWADEIRRDRRETGPWHYVNIPLGSQYDARRDCALPHSCVVAKIENFVRVLTDNSAAREERAEDLKFIVHFVGDIHQPMHAVKEAAGGNGIHVNFQSSDRCGPYECNLHGVWDTSMILHTGLNREAYAEREEELIKAQKLDTKAGGTPEEWANESLRLAEAAWVQDGTDLKGDYYQREIKVVDRQMALAGLRLARLLNETIGRMTPRDFAASKHKNVASRVSASPEHVPQDAAMNAAGSIKVWVNTRSSVYHCPNTEWYGNTKRGVYMTQAEAQEEGYHPAGGNTCR